MRLLAFRKRLIYTFERKELHFNYEEHNQRL